MRSICRRDKSMTVRPFAIREYYKKSYLQVKKKSSHVPMGKNGRKNCLVIGIRRMIVAPNTVALFRRSALGLTHNEKMMRNASTRY